jgi:ParB family chromosome partitioning protein
MKKPLLLNIALDSIDIGKRLRPADEGAVEALSVDIAVRGLRVPIEISEGRKGGYVLVSGLHRLTACRRLGWTEILAFTVEGNKLELRRDELLENLTRSELSKLERCQFLTELKRVHLEMYPEAAHGGDRRSTDFQELHNSSWSAAAISRTGWAKATLKKAVSIGERLAPEIADTLRGTALEDNLSELEALSKYGVSIQRSIANLIADGGSRSVAGAVRILSGSAEGPNDAEEKAAEKTLARMLDLWERLGTRDRDRFLTRIGASATNSDVGEE